MSVQLHNVHDLSNSDQLRLLSVRIMDKNKVVKGSGLLYVIRGHEKAYVLTAAHVVNAIPEQNVVVVECQTDKLDENNVDNSKYVFEVCRSDIVIDSCYVPTPELAHGRIHDAAVIPLTLDPIKHCWMESREEAYFLSEKVELKDHRITGFGYPNYKQYMGKSIDEAYVEVRSSEACCSQHTAVHHTTQWKLCLDIVDYETKDEVGGWSGSILVLADHVPIILAGVVLERYPEGKGKEILGADMYCIRMLLENELQKNQSVITVREYPCAEKEAVVRASESLCDRMVPSPLAASFCIEGGYDDFIYELVRKAKPNTPLILFGPAGCGKTELARAIPGKFEIDEVSYTIPFCPSERVGEDDMKASILATSTITGAPFHEGSEKEREEEFDRRLKILSTKDDGGHTIRKPRWIIVDDFYHPQKRFTDLLRDPTFNLLRKQGNYLICTTRYNLDSGGNKYEVPPLFNTRKGHRRALKSQMYRLSQVPIHKRQFKKCYSLTGGNLLLADWTRKTLECVKMKDILKALKTGVFLKNEFCWEIEDERTGSRNSLENHIHDLYNIDDLKPEAKNVLALLQFVGRYGWARGPFMDLLSVPQKRCLATLTETGWCTRKNHKISIDPALKLTCRVRKLTPDQQELKELLGKMYNAYAGSKSTEHYTAIRAYFKAARKAVPAFFDDEMLRWHSEICGVQGGW